MSFPHAGFALAASLVSSPGYRMSREEAANTLWDQKSARSNLRQLLVRMRKAAPDLDDVLTFDQTTIWLRDAEAHVDAAAFERLEAPGHPAELEYLIANFAAPLLDEVPPPSETYAERLHLQRLAVQGKFIALAESGLKHAGRYGNLPLQLLRSAETALIAANPQREETYQALITAYGASGWPFEARRILDLLDAVRKTDGEPAPVFQTRSAVVTAVAPAFPASQDPHLRKPVSTPVQLPRVALLAPRWIDDGGEANLLRLLVEDVADELARYRSFAALAPHSTFQAVHDGGIIADNRQLRADYTVSSFVRASGAAGSGTLCVRLVDCASTSIVWASQLELRREQLAASSRTLVSGLGAEITRAIESDILNHPERTQKSSAYLHYLRGQDAMKSCNLRNVRRARKSYAAAVREDANFAEAYAGLSSCNYFEWLLLGGWTPKLLADARELAELAIAKDPVSSSGYWRLATVSLHQHDFDTSEENYERSRALHPNSADIILQHADAKGHVSNPKEAWELFMSAIDLNPTPPDHYWWTGAGIAFSNRDYQLAIDLCKRVEDDESVLRLMAASHGQLGNLTEARLFGQRLKECYPNESAESMTRLQPHKTKDSLQTFIEGLRIAGIN